MYTSASCTAVSPRLLLDSTNHSANSSADSDSRAAGFGLPSLVAFALTLFLVPALFAQQAPYDGVYAPYQQSGYAQSSFPQSSYGQPQSYDRQSSAEPYDPTPGQTNGLDAGQLEQLVAPIALYPDALVAQVLAASTYPQQLAEADRWRRAQGSAPQDQIAAGADAQPWDPSVKALTAFPHVLAQMDYNLQWATELGDAYFNQPQDVLEAVQIMRQRAQSAGSLRSTPQQAVNYEQGNIALAPVNPQEVYVPEYNPWSVYGEPVSPYPGFSLLGDLGSVFDSSVVRFGLGIAMDAFSRTPWGLLGWGLDWLTQSVLFNNSNYYSHSNTVADWGFHRGGVRAFPPRGRGAMAANRSSDGYGRWGGRYTPTRSQGFSRTQDQDRDAYAGHRSGAGAGAAEGYGRGHQTFGAVYNRTSRDGFSSFRPAVSRSQSYGRSAYRSDFYNSKSARTNGGRHEAGYGSSMPAYRASAANFRHSDFGKHSSRNFKGNGFAGSYGKQSHSGGHHLFGGGGHAPKSYGGGKSFGHGRSGGGGHSGGHSHSGGKHRH